MIPSIKSISQESVGSALSTAGTVAGMATGNPAIAAGLSLGGVAFGTLIDRIRAGASVSSLADVGKPARIEPIVVLDRSLQGNPALQDVLQTCASMIGGYYLQAFAIAGNIKSVETRQVLDQLNPTRDSKTPLAKKTSSEAYGFEEYNPLFHDPIPSLEDNTKSLYENQSLAVGKLLYVNVTEGNNTVQLPVMVAIRPSVVDENTISDIFSINTKNKGFRDRWILARTGQIRMVRDFMLNLDLIDEHRRTLAKDNSGIYSDIQKRRNRNSIAAYKSGRASLADCSNILIVSTETVKSIERKVNGKLSNEKTREAIFNDTYLTLMVIVNEKWQTVSIYHRGFKDPTELSYQQLKQGERAKGPDISEILAAYMQANTPSL